MKEIAVAADIKANMLYKWKTMPIRLSQEKADRLLLYFMEHGPGRLELAELV